MSTRHPKPACECSPRELSNYIYEFRAAIKRERERFCINREKLQSYEKALDIYMKERDRRGCMKKNCGNGYKQDPSQKRELRYLSPPNTDARVAEELGYPIEIVKKLLKEPDEHERQRILIGARKNFA